MVKQSIAKRLNEVHSDIRGPVFFRALDIEKSGEKVLKLNTGNPATFGFKMPESVKNTIETQAEKGLGYCDLRGIKEARQAIVDYETSKGIKDLTIDDVFICNGVSEAVSMLTTAIVDDGDEVLVPSPCYSLWSNSVLLAGGVPVFYDCVEEDGWNPDIKDIESKITDKTKGIVIINPNNPTGVLYSDEILLAIADIARRHNILVFSDEIYDRLVYDGLTHNSFAKLADDIDVITLNGLSKSHCMCGLRCGWIVLSGKSEFMKALNKSLVTIASVRLCSNALMQLTIPTALKDTEYTKNMIEKGGRLYEQRQAVMDAIDKVEGLSVVKTQGAFYCFPKIDRNVYNITDKEFARELLEKKKILIVAGSGFAYKHPDHFRIVMLPESMTLANAIYEIGDFLKDYKK